MSTEYSCEAVLDPTLSNDVWRKISPWTSLDWSRGKKTSFDGCNTKMALKGSKTNEKKTLTLKKRKKRHILEKVSEVFFSPMCLIYIYSQRSKRLLVWENRQRCHWLTNGEPEPDYHTKSHQHQTPLTPFSLHTAFLNFHLCAILTEFKEMTQTICVSHPHAVHTWTPTPPHSKRSHSGTDTNAYICRNLKIA